MRKGIALGWTAPRHRVPKFAVEQNQEPSITEITRVAIDTSKSVFTIHAVDARDRPVLRRNLRRQDVAGFFAKLPPVEVAIEACGASHHWGRSLQAMGHSVRLIPPQYVKPFVKRGKNDRNDAQAISEAAARPGMPSVAVKTAERQADAKLMARHKATPESRLLAEVPGIGPIGALNIVLRVDAAQFKSARHFAAWLGLTPRDHSTGGKQRLGGITRAGNERLRQLLVLGATAVIQHAKPGRASAWLLALLERRPRKLAAVALANKMARIVWAMMTSGETYRQPVPVAT